MLSGKNHYESETEIKELQNVIDYTVKFKYLEISLPLWPYIKFEHLYSELRKCHDWIFPRLTDITIMSYYTVKMESYYRCLFICLLLLFYTIMLFHSSDKLKEEKKLFCYLCILICEHWWGSLDFNVVLEERFHWLLPGDCCLDQIFLFAIADNLQKKGNENRKWRKHISVEVKHIWNISRTIVLSLFSWWTSTKISLSQQSTFSWPSQHFLGILSSLLFFANNL